MRPGLSSEHAVWLRHPRISVVEQDVTRFDFARLPPAIEAVFTLAQSSHFRDFPAKAEEIFAVNVTSNLQLLQWAVAAGVKRYVHVSSGGIYGGRQGGQFLETELLPVDSPLGFYLGSKLCAEVVFQNYRHFFDAAIILRPFFVYGPGQRSDMFIARLIESVKKGTPIQLQGDAGLRVNPIFVADAALSISNALNLNGCHIINLAGPDVLSLREISEIIGAAVGRAPVFEPKSGPPVDYVADIAREVSQLLPALTPFREGIVKAIRNQEPF